MLLEIVFFIEHAHQLSNITIGVRNSSLDEVECGIYPGEAPFGTSADQNISVTCPDPTIGTAVRVARRTYFHTLMICEAIVSGHRYIGNILLN